MATLSFNISNAAASKVTNALCARFGYQETITNQDGTTSPNTMTKAEFAQRMVAREIKSWVIEQELNTALTTARQTEYDKLNSEIVIT